MFKEKRAIYLLILAGLFYCATPVSAQNVNITNPLNGINNFPDLLSQIVTAVGGLIAGLGTIMIIVAGILYLTSAGSPERIGAAKKALAYAVIGIVIGIIAAGVVSIIKGILGAQ